MLAFDVRQGEWYGSRRWSRSSRRATGDHGAAAQRGAQRQSLPDFDEALRVTRAWEELWDVSDVQLPNEPRAQFVLGCTSTRSPGTCSRLTAHHDAGVTARGLNGEAYRGHVFWDELYVYPFLNFRLPEITRSSLLHRYRRLDEARAAAARPLARRHVPLAERERRAGGDAGRPTSNSLSGRWEPDLSRNQRHVNAAIFYNIWRTTRRPMTSTSWQRPRRGDDARDRALLAVDRPLQPQA